MISPKLWWLKPPLEEGILLDELVLDRFDLLKGVFAVACAESIFVTLWSLSLERPWR